MSSHLRRTLPLRFPDWRAHPTVDAMRARLGGRGTSLDGVGELVEARGQVGVVLFVSDREVLDVYLGAHVVQRLARIHWTAFTGDTPADLVTVTEAIRVFATLREGDSVEFDTPDPRTTEGALVEKCRFGGLVLRDDGVVVGVGFQRLRRRVQSSDN